MTDSTSQACTNLRHAIVCHGAESAEARTAAIDLCRICGIDPYYRYAIWPKMAAPSLSSEPVVNPAPIPAVEEWELQVKRFASENASADKRHV